MPRVHTVVTRAASKPRSCARCGEPIEIGQTVYKWTRRNWPTAYQHQACGYPRASQLSSRKTAIIDDAIQDADWSLGEIELGDAAPGDSFDIDTAHLEEILGGIADEADNVASEYSESADNLPEALQYGAQAEALRDVSQRLEEWASDLRSPSFDNTRVELRELDDDESIEDWRDEMIELINETAEALSQEAQDLVTEVPEYEG